MTLSRDQVWDGLTGTQLQSLTTHEADVLCLCVAEGQGQGQTQLFASGCDGKVWHSMATCVLPIFYQYLNCSLVGVMWL